MSDSSVNLSLPYLMPSQAQKHVTHNEALAILDTVVQLAVADRDRTEPPESATAGSRHIVAGGATGAWAGQEDSVALWDGSAWRFLRPQPGWRAWVQIEAADLVWRDEAWGLAPLPVLDDLDRVGVNTVADAENRLAVAAGATLLTHDGADHRLKINKAGPGDTASLLFQTGWSGRAEMGLAGNDDWSLKVSPDGTTWTEALTLEMATGLATGAAVQSSEIDTTAGRLLRVGSFGMGAGQGVPAPNNNADDCLIPGFNYRFTTAGINAPVGNPYGATLHVFAGTGGNRLQQLFLGSVDGLAWLRASADGGGSWGAWQQIYTQNTILGTVSQSFGTPTGAIIERGSNANGEYVRFADGTQICSHTQVHDFSTSQASAYGFPAAFVSSPSATISFGNTSVTARQDRFNNVVLMVSGGAWSVAARSTASESWTGILSAIGRWF